VTEPLEHQRRTELERIREVYRVRDAAPRRSPAIAAAYRRLNAERTRLMRALIAPVAPPALGRIVDVGCGSGFDLAAWVADGWRAEHLAGVDVISERVSKARAACPGADIRLGDGVLLPFGDGAFDAATATTVFSSILDRPLRQTLFREMERVVRPGGLVVVYDFVIRKPTNPDVRGLSLKRLAELDRAPAGSRRLSPLLHLVAGAELLHPRIGDLAMRLAPRTHRLSWWTSVGAGGTTR
jgi:ubiquinone/menaquinone biosynthesis C-methylase UbiE